MKKLFVVPMAAFAAVGLVACAESPTETLAPQFELVSGGIDRDDATIEIVATFTHTITGGTAYRPQGSPGINEEGKEIGTCEAAGAWRNPAGKVTGARPHSHCVTVGTGLTISLEPISGTHETYCHGSCGNDNRRTADKLTFDAAGDMFVTYNKSSANASNWYMQGQGLIVAHAVDQNGNRHGIFTFDLDQFSGSQGGADLFDTYVNIGTEEAPIYVWGLDKPIDATYTDPSGNTTVVQGWIYWDEL